MRKYAAPPVSTPRFVLSYATLVDEKFCERVGVPLEALRAAQEDV